jgi:hypothetical protein
MRFDPMAHLSSVVDRSGQVSAANSAVSTSHPQFHTCLQGALNIIDGHDRLHPDQNALLDLLESGLNARAQLVQSALNPWPQSSMRALLLILALKTASNMEAA